MAREGTVDHEAPGAGFRHPYYFIPVSPGRTYSEGPARELGDREPHGHDRFVEEAWSGRLSVRLTVATPLLLPDASRATGHQHRVLPMRLGPDGLPDLPPTSVRGALRTAFEAVTNSRFGVFEEHERRFAFRQDARVAQGRRFQPVLVRAREIQFASTAALRRYPKDQRWEPLRYVDEPRALPQHGDIAYARVQNRVVIEIAHRRDGFRRPGVKSYKGHVWVSNDNIDRKHAERFFYLEPEAKVVRFTGTQEAEWDRLMAEWKELMKSYQDANRREVDARKREGEPLDQRLDTRDAMSRHILHPELFGDDRPGFAFAHLDGADNIRALFPVHISRELHPLPPALFLDASLQPAARRNELSPADRVFGWTRGRESHRGQLRVGRARCVPAPSLDPVRRFDPPLPLAILSSPRPQQARFYLGVRQGGTVVEQGKGDDRRESGYRYSDVRHLRGRKVYPHQVGQPDGHWTDPWAAVERGQRREYVRESGERGPRRDDQNVSVSGWVEPGTAFELELRVTNLSDVELGALLWLLHLPDGCHLRLGAGKPLGFGSVRMELVGHDLSRGDALRRRYATLGAVDQPDPDSLEHCVGAFVAATEAAHGRFQDVPHIAAFLRAANGVAWPVHYPRVRERRRLGVRDEAKSYEWFVANEKPNRRHPLPDLTSPGISLPYLDSEKPQSDKGGSEERRP